MTTEILYGTIDHTGHKCDICDNPATIGIITNAIRTVSKREIDFETFLCEKHKDLSTPRMLKAKAGLLYMGLR